MNAVRKLADERSTMIRDRCGVFPRQESRLTRSYDVNDGGLHRLHPIRDISMLLLTHGTGLFSGVLPCISRLRSDRTRYRLHFRSTRDES